MAGQGANAYLWVEADPDVAALLRCYPDAAMLRRVAEIIRSWADEEPRALWERLRAERKARGPRVDEGGTAGWIVAAEWAYRRGEPDSGFALSRAEEREWRSADGRVDFMRPWTCEKGAETVDRLAEYATIVSSNRLINVAGPDLMNTGKGGTTFGGGEFATPAADVADAFERVAGEVASFQVSSSWSYEQGNTRTGFVGPGDRRQDTTATATATARLSDRGRWPPVLVLPTIPTAAEVAEWLGTPGDLEGVIRYADPPYLGTTGYLHDYPRADVVRLARDYAALGAIVCISEAEPIPELVADGWHIAEITEGRRGQKRTFSAQKREYLTMNREPKHRVATQAGLFG